MTTATGTANAALNNLDLHGLESACTATRHGTLTAYHAHHCRCAIARKSAMRHDKNYRARRLHEGPQLIDATGTRRRLQALAAVGYSMPEIASHGTVHPNQLKFIVSSRERVHVDTARDIETVYRELADKAPRGRYAVKVRNLASSRGWLPPIWWDDDLIDDPAHDPLQLPMSDRGKRCQTQPSVDPIAVERFVAGDRTVTLNRPEKGCAYAEMLRRGISRNEVMRRLRISGTTARALADELQRVGVAPDDQRMSEVAS